MIYPLSPYGADYVMRHLSHWDDIEMRATMFDGDVHDVARRVYCSPGPKFEARTRQGHPAVIGGFMLAWPGLAMGWLWGTDEWPKVALEVTRFTRRRILPELDEMGVHRIECRALAGNKKVIRWLELIGFKQEAVTAQFGQGREDFVLCARTIGYAGPTH